MNLHEYVTEICPTTTQKWIRDGALLLDVREQDEVDSLAFDVPNLIHIPYSQFENRYTEVPKDQNVVVVCHSGSRSLSVAAFLKYNGYEHVVNMKHGILRWVERGFSVKGDVASVFSKTNTNGCGCGSSATKEKTSCCTPDHKDVDSCCSTGDSSHGNCC